MATQTVVAAVCAAAEENAARPATVSGQRNAAVRLCDDRLAEFYVRRAAAAARRLPPELGAKAFLLGLGAGCEDAPRLRDDPLLGPLLRRVESDQQRTRRRESFGQPTVRGRADLAQHFFVSAALTALAGAVAADAAGLAKETDDAQRGSGFSFADLAADRAGVRFAEHVLAGKLDLDRLARSFAVADFVPEINDLPEGLKWDDFTARYGTPGDERFRRQMAEIARRLEALPGYKDERRGGTQDGRMQNEKCKMQNENCRLQIGARSPCCHLPSEICHLKSEIP